MGSARKSKIQLYYFLKGKLNRLEGRVHSRAANWILKVDYELGCKVWQAFSLFKGRRDFQKKILLWFCMNFLKKIEVMTKWLSFPSGPHLPHLYNGTGKTCTSYTLNTMKYLQVLSHISSTRWPYSGPFTLFPECLIPNLTSSPNIKAKHCLAFDIYSRNKKTYI